MRTMKIAPLKRSFLDVLTFHSVRIDKNVILKIHLRTNNIKMTLSLEIWNFGKTENSLESLLFC